MRRRALILHYAGDVTNYLTGVSADIENIKIFFIVIMVEHGRILK